MRLFAAILPDESFLQALLSLQDALREEVRGRFLPRENLHLTLAFLGELPDPAPVLRALERVRGSAPTLTLTGIGAFRDTVHARVGGGGALLSLARELREELAREGLPFDRARFLPHITLVRSARWEGDLPAPPLPSAEMVVREVTLLRSTLTPQGAIYRAVGGVPLER